jgi:hypothetical protein
MREASGAALDVMRRRLLSALVVGSRRIVHVASLSLLRGGFIPSER